MTQLTVAALLAAIGLIQLGVAALIVAIGMMSPATAQTVSVKAGIEAWRRGNHATATTIWRSLAEKGDADAAFNLGQAYRVGRGVPRDPVSAKSWFERAARKGHVNAQTMLGLMLFQSGDHVPAVAWLKIAAERGDPRAQLAYGTALFNGQGVRRDESLGTEYVRKAAAEGLEAAKKSLAEIESIPPVAVRPSDTRSQANHATAKTAPNVAATRAAPPVRFPASVEGPWRIQLGAFSQRGSAESLFRHLSARNGPLAGMQSYFVPAGPLTRLQVGPFPSRDAAAAACSTLKAGGQSCLPVPAK